MGSSEGRSLRAWSLPALAFHVTSAPILPLLDALLMEGVTLTQDAQQLNGSERAVLDGLLTPTECGVLLKLAKVCIVCGSAAWLGTPRLSRMVLALDLCLLRALSVSTFSFFSSSSFSRQTFSV